MNAQTEQDVVDVIKAQHQQVRLLFSKLEGLTGEAALGPFQELTRLLAVHETAEEMVVYPALRKAPGGEAVAERRKEEEAQAKQALSDLESLGPESAEFARGLASFKSMVEAHAGGEEDEVLPLLRSHLDAQELGDMRKLFEAAEKAAPTHPHPHGPDGALGNLVVGPAVAIMDKVRDALRTSG
jgi:hemerythrin superfamily protein